MYFTLTILEYVLLLIFCIFLAWYFPSPSVPQLCRVTVFITWVLGFAGIILLCADLASVQTSHGSDYLLPWWNAIYWSTFILAWLIIPLMNFYYRGGHFDKWPALASSIRFNLKWYLICGALVLIMILYGVIALKASWSTMVGLSIALGNTYGLVLIILLLGHGIVTLPRKLWIYRDPRLYIQELYLRAVQVDDDKQDSYYDLKDVEDEVKLMVNSSQLDEDDGNRTVAAGGKYKTDSEKKAIDNLRYVYDVAKNFEFSPSWSAINNSNRSASQRRPTSSSEKAKLTHVSSSSSSSSSLTQIEVVTLHSKLVLAHQTYYSDVNRWNLIIQQTQSTTAIIDNGPRIAVISRYWLFGSLSVICSILTCISLWCELTLWYADSDLSIFAIIINLALPDGDSDEDVSLIEIQVLTIIPLLYLAVCMYYSFFRLKFFGIFTLYGPHLSNSTQLFFSSQFLCRFQFSLCYHYVLLLHYKDGKRTAFDELMSGMEIIPILGSGFNVYGPLLLVLLAIFTYLNGYAKLLRLIGIDTDDAYVLETDSTISLKWLIKLFKRMKRKSSNDVDHATIEDEDDEELSEHVIETRKRIEDGKALVNMAISRARFANERDGNENL